jgi:N-succinyldiaminopimelate aminotransferase
MNPGLTLLQPYPFERLATLRRGLREPPHLKPINLSIGEPQHATPAFIHQALIENLTGTGKYPATRGNPEIRETIAAWLGRRFRLGDGAVDPERMVLPVTGTREALFAVAQAFVDGRSSRNAVLMPNPFYQIYEGAALLAGAQPVFMSCPAERGFLPALETLDPATLDRCALMYLCTPSNPAGTVMTERALQDLIALADRHNFILVSDECYSELYTDEQRPPPGLLQAAWAAGRTDFRRCLVMHSLSKRSNAPGLRSGFVAGDPALIEQFLRYRTYHGCAMPLHVQAASVAAWSDETHVVENRARYRAKFKAVRDILGDVLSITIPEGGFYLWPEIPGDELVFCQRLIETAGVTTLPGRFLAREVAGVNPGAGRLRIALVAEEADCVAAAQRIREILIQA